MHKIKNNLSKSYLKDQLSPAHGNYNLCPQSDFKEFLHKYIFLWEKFNQVFWTVDVKQSSS